MKILIGHYLLLISIGLSAGFCEDRYETFTKKIANNDSSLNFEKILKSNAKLIVFGEAHRASYMKHLHKILPKFISEESISCAFIEQPVDLKQSEIDSLILGENTEHFQTEASFDYVPFYKFLRENNVTIIPVDRPYTSPNGIAPIGWMKNRDDLMFSKITENVHRCQRSIFLIGKHHITPDIQGYTPTLGDRIKSHFKDDVLHIDLIASRNYQEDYCSYTQNRLFKKTTLINTKGLEQEGYSNRSNHSFYSDFDYIYYHDES